MCFSTGSQQATGLFLFRSGVVPFLMKRGIKFGRAAPSILFMSCMKLKLKPRRWLGHHIGISLDQVPVVRAVPNTTPIRQRPRPVSSQININRWLVMSPTKPLSNHWSFRGWSNLCGLYILERQTEGSKENLWDIKRDWGDSFCFGLFPVNWSSSNLYPDSRTATWYGVLFFLGERKCTCIASLFCF